MIRSNRRVLPVIAALAVGSLSLAASAPAFAYDPASTRSINVDDGAILKGHDPVAYFTTGKPTKGSSRFTATYDGAAYHFANAENLRAFKASPAKYAPQYGGFCAMGAALGKKLDVDPEQFKVVDGNVYLNVDADVFKKWWENVPANIQAADQNWPAIRGQAPNAL